MCCRDRFILFFIFGIMLFAGCQRPLEQDEQTDVQKENADFIKGIKLSDLRESNPETLPQDAVLIFRFFTFFIEPKSIPQLKGIFDELSHKNIRFADKEAFSANGISVGLAPYQKGVEAVQVLQQIGAGLSSQTNASLMQNITEPLSSVSIGQKQTVLYSTSETGLATVDLEAGDLGWIITAHAEPKQVGIVQVKLEPAFWQSGIEDLRFRVNKDPYDYYKFNQARILARMNAGDVMILAPNRKVPLQETLDKYLFYVPGRHEKVKVIVIVCQNPGL